MKSLAIGWRMMATKDGKEGGRGGGGGRLIER